MGKGVKSRQKAKVKRQKQEKKIPNSNDQNKFNVSDSKSRNYSEIYFY
jgi:hypothetical protein